MSSEILQKKRASGGCKFCNFAGLLLKNAF